MKLRISSNGRLGGTVVVDAATGREVEGVRLVRWQLDLEHGLAHAELELDGVEIKAEAGAGVGVLGDP